MAKKNKLVKVDNKKLEKAKLMWAGAIDLMKKSESSQHSEERNSILVVAKALRISPFGINILGGLPYVNNLGRKQKLQHYEKGSTFEYNWVRRSETDDDKAICEARIVSGKKVLTPWIVGECSPGSMKMGTLKGHQNHMAQTRAENRAVQYLVGLDMHLELIERIAEMQKKGEVTEQQALNAARSTLVSPEEMNVVEDNKPQPKDEFKPSGDDAKMQAIAQGILTKVKDEKTAKVWLDKIKADKTLTKEVKETAINLLETKIKMYKKG